MRERLRELTRAAHWEEAFGLLHAQLADRLKRFILGRAPSVSVDDLSQVVWLAVHDSLESFRFESEPETWVFAIARWKIVEALRKRQEVILSDPAGPEMRWSEGLSESGSPFSELLYTERARLIRQILDGWDTKERLLFEMRFFADMDPVEIAETFDPPMLRNTVTTRLIRLVERLRQQLGAITSVASR